MTDNFGCISPEPAVKEYCDFQNKVVQDYSSIFMLVALIPGWRLFPWIGSQIETEVIHVTVDLLQVPIILVFAIMFAIYSNENIYQRKQVFCAVKLCLTLFHKHNKYEIMDLLQV